MSSGPFVIVAISSSISSCCLFLQTSHFHCYYGLVCLFRPLFKQNYKSMYGFCLSHLFSCIRFIIYEQFVHLYCWVELHFSSLLIYLFFSWQTIEVFFFFHFGLLQTVTVNCPCQLDWIWGHLGDTALGVPLMRLSELSNWKWMMPPHGLITGKEKSRQTSLSLLPDWLSYEKTSIAGALGRAFHYIFPAMMNCTFKPRAKINSFSFMLFLVMSYQQER